MNIMLNVKHDGAGTLFWVISQGISIEKNSILETFKIISELWARWKILRNIIFHHEPKFLFAHISNEQSLYDVNICYSIYLFINSLREKEKCRTWLQRHLLSRSPIFVHSSMISRAAFFWENMQEQNWNICSTEKCSANSERRRRISWQLSHLTRRPEALKIFPERPFDHIMRQTEKVSVKNRQFPYRIWANFLQEPFESFEKWLQYFLRW